MAQKTDYCNNCGAHKRNWRKRKKSSGSKKGTPFEREMSKELSWWWSWGERDDLIWRTSDSGGRATQRAKTNQITKYQHGDLGPTDFSIYPLFDFFLMETKRGYDDDLDLLLHIDQLEHRVTVPILRQWKETALRDMEAASRKEIMILLQRDGKRKLAIIRNILLGNLLELDWEKWSKFSSNSPVIIAEEMSIYRMDEFFSYFMPEDVPKLLAMDYYK